MIDRPTNRAQARAKREIVADPHTLMRIKSLQVRARIVVEGFLTGLHRSPYHGFSVEFTEYRQYSPGDDLRYLDWRLLARSDRYYVKRFEDETNLRCHILLDLSRSMDYGTVDYTKAEYGKTLAATLAYFLNRQRDAVGLLTFDETIDTYLPARFQFGALARLMSALERPTGGKGTDINQPLEQTARIVRKRGWVILISDLLTDIESLEKHLGALRTQGHEVILMRVLDPSEKDFEFSDATLFHDMESGRELYVDPKAARSQYLEKFQQHAEQIESICNSLGVDLCELTTDTPLELALFDFLNARQRRGRTASRSRNPMAGGV
ncbi:MAG: DUF58 domain-containing protein [Pirellulaceae bacterium]|jgi:uncharacterized protein (DUF58 family)